MNYLPLFIYIKVDKVGAYKEYLENDCLKLYTEIFVYQSRFFLPKNVNTGIVKSVSIYSHYNDIYSKPLKSQMLR